MKFFLKGILIFFSAIVLIVILTVAGIAIKLWWPDADKMTTYALRGDIEKVRLCAKFGVNPNEPSRWGWNHECVGKTPLTAAAENGQIEMVKHLLVNGAEINRKDGQGNTAIITACYSGDLSLVKLLHEKGADLSIMGDSGGALHRASGLGYIPIMEFLIDSGASIDATDEFGISPLYSAAIGGKVEAVRFLLDHGAGKSLDAFPKKRIIDDLQGLLARRKSDYDLYAEKNGWADQYAKGIAPYQTIMQYLTQDKAAQN